MRLFFDLFKLRIGLVIGFTAVAGLAITPGPALPGWQVLALALAVTLASAAAGAFNQYVERDLDARMGRTRRRAFVTGRLTAGPGVAGRDHRHRRRRRRAGRRRDQPAGGARTRSSAPSPTASSTRCG